MQRTVSSATTAQRGLRSSVEPLEHEVSASRRIDSIDLLRGIVMVIMMLDHTRDFVHNAALQFDPLDLTRTNSALFFTRWITHYCAPIFVFLAGTSIYLQSARGKTRNKLSHFLVSRGFWLIVLEFTLVRLGAFFNFDFRFLGVLQVIWVIGVSMIVLAALIHLPVKVVGAFGLTMIALHNLLDPLQVTGWRGPGTAVPGLGAKLWIILHQPFNAFPILGWPSPVVAVIYPVIPWVGVMAAGYAFGSIYRLDWQKRRLRLLTIGGVATLLFIILRAINVYGDPAPWAAQKNALYTFLSFLNTTKYPPSLLFLLMTLGPAIVLLAWFDSGTAPPIARASRQQNEVSPSQRRSHSTSSLGARAPRPHSSFERLQKALVTFGRVPLFFYLLQWPTAHLISLLLHLAFGKPVNWLFQTPLDWNGAPVGIGFNLAVVYAAWIVGVLLLYPLCRWFANVKRRRRDWWLSYL